MSFAYIVRCNFTAPDKEQAWNSWYSGPKIREMLAKPHFRSCQRFKRVSGKGRDYVALWTLDTPDAFATKEYTSDWGFFEWQPYIADWSRDLFDARDAADDTLAVAAGEALHLIAFDGLTAEDARARMAKIAPDHDGMLWLPIAGLDRHTALIGLQRVAGDAARTQILSHAPEAATYKPICERFSARA